MRAHGRERRRARGVRTFAPSSGPKPSEANAEKQNSGRFWHESDIVQPDVTTLLTRAFKADCCVGYRRREHPTLQFPNVSCRFATRKRLRSQPADVYDNLRIPI